MFKDRRSLAPSQKRQGILQATYSLQGQAIISDAHEGLKAAIAQVFKAS
jgi:hypothetical protein